MTKEPALEVPVKCPACGHTFKTDPHRAFRCSHCGALLDYTPVGVFVVMNYGEMLSGGRY